MKKVSNTNITKEKMMIMIGMQSNAMTLKMPDLGDTTGFPLATTEMSLADL